MLDRSSVTRGIIFEKTSNEQNRDTYQPIPTFFKKNGPNPGSFCLFSSFLHGTNQILIDKSIDGVLGTRTRGGRMEGVDESTELWRHPYLYLLTLPTHANLYVRILLTYIMQKIRHLMFSYLSTE